MRSSTPRRTRPDPFGVTHTKDDAWDFYQAGVEWGLDPSATEAWEAFQVCLGGFVEFEVRGFAAREIERATDAAFELRIDATRENLEAFRFAMDALSKKVLGFAVDWEPKPLVVVPPPPPEPPRKSWWERLFG